MDSGIQRGHMIGQITTHMPTRTTVPSEVKGCIFTRGHHGNGYNVHQNNYKIYLKAYSTSP